MEAINKFQLKDVSMRVQQGTIVTVYGRNGSGTMRHGRQKQQLVGVIVEKLWFRRMRGCV